MGQSVQGNGLFEWCPTARLTGLMRAFLASILVFGVVLQLNSLNRSFWSDEVWVANAAIAPTLSQMMYYEGWQNTNPPLFLLLVRSATRLFGVSHGTLRLVPVIFGILSVFAMTYLALHILSPWYAILSVFLFSLSSDIVTYAKTLKPYSADVFVAIVLLVLAHHTLRNFSRKVFYLSILTFCICEFLSYQAVIFLPALLYAACLNCRDLMFLSPRHDAKTCRWFDILAFLILASTVLVINFIYFIKPNSELSLIEFWSGSFYRGNSILSLLHYLIIAMAKLTGPFFFVDSLHFPLLHIVLLVFVATGAIGLVSNNDGDGRFLQWHTGILLCLPILGLVVLNLLGQYPITRSSRLILFSFPIIVILFSSGLQSVIMYCSFFGSCAKINTPAANKIQAMAGPSLLALATCLFVAALWSSAGGEPYVRLTPGEESKQVFRYLSARHKPDDLLYIHSTMREHYKFYSKFFPIEGGHIIHGRIGQRCCPRLYVNDRNASAAEVMPAEFDRLNSPEKHHNVRLLFTNLQNYWHRFGRNDPDEFEIWLSERGCRKAGRLDLKGILLDEYVCGAAHKRVASATFLAHSS
jgi:hypothetical protein